MPNTPASPSRQNSVLTINLLSNLLNRAPFHYAWVVVGTLALVQMVALSVNFAGGVLVEPLMNEGGKFGFSASSVGLSFTLFFLAGAMLSPVAGWLGERYGPRKMMIVASLGYCCVMVLVAFVSAPWELWLSFGILRGAVQAIFMVPLMAAVSAWFRQRLGLATGLLWAASGIGPAVMAPLLINFVQGVDWQTTFTYFGLAAGAFILLLTLVFRSKPADVGALAYGARAGDVEDSGISPEQERARAKVFNQHVRRTKAFWNLPAIHGLGCAGHGIILLFIAPFAIMKGLTFTEAALTLSILSLVSIPSRMLTPMIAEKYGTKPIMATCLMIQGLTVLMLFVSTEWWHFYLFAVLFGIGFGGEWTGYLVINRQYYGNGPIGSVYGWQMSGAQMGHAFVSWVSGIMLDMTGSYNVLFAVSAAMSIAGAVVTMTLEDTSKRLIGDWESAVPDVEGSDSTDTRPAPSAAD
ncbi:MAG: MFS transporter [Chloroflexi bacterium]|nr:MFS transporter [Chloroflexota bacterium]